jgi:hypothetical protein
MAEEGTGKTFGLKEERRGGGGRNFAVETYDSLIGWNC